MRKLIAENALLLFEKTDVFFPCRKKRLVNHGCGIGVGMTADNAFAGRMRADYNADVIYF